MFYLLEARIWTRNTGEDTIEDKKTQEMTHEEEHKRHTKNTGEDTKGTRMRHKIGESVETVLMTNEGRVISVCPEEQGESIAIKNDGGGFYTVSEAADEENSADQIDIPIFYHPILGDSKI